MAETYQDQFLAKNMEEIKEVSKKQIEYYKKTNGEEKLIDSSLGDLVQFFVGKNEDKMNQESQKLFRTLRLNEQLYFSHVVKGYARTTCWPEISKVLK